MKIKQTNIKSEYYSLCKYYGIDYMINMFRDYKTYKQLRKTVDFKDILIQLSTIKEL